MIRHGRKPSKRTKYGSQNLKNNKQGWGAIFGLSKRKENRNFTLLDGEEDEELEVVEA